MGYMHMSPILVKHLEERFAFKTRIFENLMKIHSLVIF